MRKTVNSLALVGLLFLGASTSAVLAQSSPPASPDGAQPSMNGEHPRHMQAHDPAKQLAHLTEKLSLTTDQQAQIKPILENFDQQFKAVQADSNLARPEKMAKMKSMHEDANTKIEAVLNDQQKQQWTELKQQQRARMRKGMEKHEGAPGNDQSAPPPPPAI